MKRHLIKRLHAFTGVLAFFIILAFFLSTVVAEVWGEVALIAAVKRVIAHGLLLLVPTMAAVGLSGTALAGSSQARIVRTKTKRMKIVAANGLLVLVPCALVLHGLARDGSLGLWFYAVQGIELIAGPVNITLIALNARDGLRMSGRLPRARKKASAG